MDPIEWVKAYFRKWKNNGYPLSIDALNALSASNNAKKNTTLQASNATVPTSQMKLEDGASLSWRQSKLDETSYIILKNDLEYTDWIVKTKRQFTSEECFRMIDPNFKNNQVNSKF